MDLSPSLKEKAIGFLTQQEKDIFDTCINDVLHDRILKSWLKNLADSTSNYRRIKTVFRTRELGSYPSTEHVLSNFSDSLFNASLHSNQWLGAEDNIIRKAYGTDISVGYFLDQGNVAQNKVKALQFSKDIQSRL